MSMSQLRDQFLTCIICNELYADPRTLQCLHTFCLECLRRWAIENRGQTDTIQCPTCRCVTGLMRKGGGVNGLPKAFFLEKLRDWVDRCGDGRRVSDEKQVERTTLQCSKCPVRAVCKSCNLLFCEHCAAEHHTDPRSDNHRVVSFTSSFSDTQSFPDDLMTPDSPLSTQLILSEPSTEQAGMVASFNEDLRSSIRLANVVELMASESHSVPDETSLTETTLCEAAHQRTDSMLLDHSALRTDEYAGTIGHAEIIASQRAIAIEHSVRGNGRAVWGIALLAGRVYVVTYSSSVMHVYDAVTHDQLLPIYVEGLKDPWDLAASPRQHCLYVCDWRGKCVFSVRPGNDNEVPMTTSKWHQMRERPRGIHISNNPNHLPPSVPYSAVFLVCDEAHCNTVQQSLHILDYTGVRPRIVKKIRLDGLGPVWQVLPLRNGFIVCHGGRWDNIHRVCRIDPCGIVTAEYGGVVGCGPMQLNIPSSIIMDSNKQILVADLSNSRILVLDGDLRLVKQLIVSGDGLELPRRLCLDEERGLLYVGQDRGEMKAFRIAEPRSSTLPTEHHQPESEYSESHQIFFPSTPLPSLLVNVLSWHCRTLASTQSNPVTSPSQSNPVTSPTQSLRQLPTTFPGLRTISTGGDSLPYESTW